jgi:phage-related baseplate assembly protein
MSRFDSIDLSQLPVPAVLEGIDAKIILGELIADFVSREPTYTSANLRSDPVHKVLAVMAYRVALERARVNTAATAVMLAYAQSTDLDNIGAMYGVARQIVYPADPLANPPVIALFEGDKSYRNRIQLSIEAYSSAGPYGAYEYFALSADTRISSVNIVGPETGLVSPGEVGIYVLSSEGNGTPSVAILNAVYAACNDPSRRPLTDRVLVRSAAITTYTANITVYANRGPSPDTIISAAKSSIARYTESRRKVGSKVHRAGIIGSAFLSEVSQGNSVFKNPIDDVTISAPVGDIDPGLGGSAYCDPANIVVTYQPAV